MPIQIYENERALRLVDPDDPLGKLSRDSGSNREVAFSGVANFKYLSVLRAGASTGVLLFASISCISSRQMVGNQLRLWMQRILPREELS